MTYDELLARILSVHGAEHPIVQALRAVVELHKPHSSRMPFCSVCTQVIQGIEDSVLYPCPTIKAIAKELGQK